MLFSLGITELMLVGATVLLTLLMFAFRQPGRQFMAVASIGLAIGALGTPADLLSTVLAGAILVAFFAGGVRFGNRRLQGT